MADQGLDLINIHEVFGALLIGYNCAAILFGLSTVQAYMYFRNFQKDPLAIKVTAAVVWLLELFHHGFMSQGVYVGIIIAPMNPKILEHGTLGFYVASLLGVFVAWIVRFFFIWRAWQLGKNTALAVCLCIPTLAATGAGLWLVIGGWATKATLKWHSEPLVATGITSVIADLAIAITMCWTLKKQSKRGHAETTIQIVDRLFLWTFETGVFQILPAVGYAISSGLMPNNYVWVAFWAVEARAYSNCFFAMLNGRSSLRSIKEGGSGHIELSVGVSTHSHSFIDPVSQSRLEGQSGNSGYSKKSLSAV